MISYAEQLRQIRDSLTKENWSKGSWVKVEKNTICLCAHSAAQKIINPTIRELFNRPNVPSTLEIGEHILRNRIISSACDGSNNSGDKRLAWTNRHNYIKTNKKDIVFYGNTNLHFLMGMFGITIDFNDHPSTTLEMLKDKLSEAAKWAEENEEFLNNN